MTEVYVRLKGCPKCGGDVLIETEKGEFNKVCLGCGFRVYAYRIESSHEHGRTRTGTISIDSSPSVVDDLQPA